MDNTELKYQTFLLNDKKNTLLYVISSLIKVYNHSLNQSEQCALIAHYRGKCDIFSGSLEESEKKAMELNKLGIKTKIEKKCV
jgi:ATP-dependent Clp protease adaptor protein ClpS